MCRAYLIGGLICVIGQGFLDLYQSLGCEKETAAAYTTLSLIFLSVLTTGLIIPPHKNRSTAAPSSLPAAKDSTKAVRPRCSFSRRDRIGTTFRSSASAIERISM